MVVGDAEARVLGSEQEVVLKHTIGCAQGRLGCRSQALIDR